MIQHDFRLDNQVALVTGASRGIGHGLALALAAAGASVAAAARSPEDLADLVGEINTAGGQAIVVRLDVTDLAQIESAVNQVTNHLAISTYSLTTPVWEPTIRQWK